MNQDVLPVCQVVLENFSKMIAFTNGFVVNAVKVLRCHFGEEEGRVGLVESLVAGMDTGLTRTKTLTHPDESHSRIDPGAMAPKTHGAQDGGMNRPRLESDLDPTL